MYQLKIDITGNDYLTRTENEGEFNTIESARRAAQEKRNILLWQYMNHYIKNYKVDITPLN